MLPTYAIMSMTILYQPVALLLSPIGTSLDLNFRAISTWSISNLMTINHNKCHVMLMSKHIPFRNELVIDNKEFIVEDSVKLLGLKIDANLTFSDHIADICKKSQWKLFALKRIRKYISQDKALLLASSFVMCQFSYSPLCWMFCSKRENDMINRIHKKVFENHFPGLFLFFYRPFKQKWNCNNPHKESTSAYD